MKRLLLAFLFTLPFNILLAQNAKVIPAAMNSSAKQHATDEYKPVSPQVKTEAEAEQSDAKKKNIKCVPGCSGKKQCIRKTSSSKNPPAESEERTSEASKK